MNEHIKYYHARVHTFQCELCDNIFTNTAELQAHIVSHTEPKTIVNETSKIGDVCALTENSQSTIYEHKHPNQSTSQVGIEELTCRHCDFEGQSGPDLETHLETEHGNLKCDSCKFTSNTEEDLEHHRINSHVTVSVDIHCINT